MKKPLSILFSSIIFSACIPVKVPEKSGSSPDEEVIDVNDRFYINNYTADITEINNPDGLWVTVCNETINQSVLMESGESEASIENTQTREIQNFVYGDGLKAGNAFSFVDGEETFEYIIEDMQNQTSTITSEETIVSPGEYTAQRDKIAHCNHRKISGESDSFGELSISFEGNVEANDMIFFRENQTRFNIYQNEVMVHEGEGYTFYAFGANTNVYINRSLEGIAAIGTYFSFSSPSIDTDGNAHKLTQIFTGMHEAAITLTSTPPREEDSVATATINLRIQ
ncbi:MAG: hypothetical protein HRU20_23780 [Pseudomonadales bacterium]|nr:hypothetical protein [Pseudomonadales bacterium]